MSHGVEGAGHFLSDLDAKVKFKNCIFIYKHLYLNGWT